MSKNIVKVNEIKIKNNTVEYFYTSEGKISEYFSGVPMSISYDFNIENIPEGILMVPFVGNILPLIWLLDSKLFVNELDADFASHFADIKKGFEKMYPMLSFSGEVIVGKRFESSEKCNKNCAVFFSGGVDAFTTLLRHINETPELITIWGADVKLSDTEGWTNVSESIKKTALDYSAGFQFIKSNFRMIIDERKLNKIVNTSGDAWWHGFQSGISIITHAAPIAYHKNLAKVYIASSFPEKMKGQYTCGSDPLIDNNIHFCGCDTIHDGYELDRQEKVRYIIEKYKKIKKPINLRVCWISSGGSNCCRCEKCYRTALEIISEGGDPNELGFTWNDRNIKKCRFDMNYVLQGKQFDIDQFYPPIQEALNKNRKKINDHEKYKWLLDIDFSKYNKMFFKRIYNFTLFKYFRKAINKAFKIFIKS